MGNKRLLILIVGALSYVPFFGQNSAVPSGNFSFSIQKDSTTIATRYLNLDKGYQRAIPAKGSYAEWLLNQSLHEYGYPTHCYDGREKAHNCQVGVLKVDFIGKDLQQCADAAIRLRAEYLYQTKQYAKIHFNFTSGFRCDYQKWASGYRVHFGKNWSAYWQKDAKEDYSYANFRKYLNTVFNYAGSLSLSKEMVKIPASDVRPGDLLVAGGSPGHVITVMDVLRSADGKRLRLMFSQSYMPAQEIEILRNDDEKGSPWFTVDLSDSEKFISTPEWNFTEDNFMRWKE